MNNLKVGYAKVVITPPMGIDISGYFQVRKAEAVLDDLHAIALAVSDGKKIAAIVSLDLLDIPTASANIIREYASQATGLDYESIFLVCTHTHTGPDFSHNHKTEIVRDYFGDTKLKIADCINFALADMKDAKMAYGTSKAERISFVRRFRMKDGSFRTNPGVNNPEILEPIGEVDERVNVVRFDREGADDIVLINFGTHPDTVGGNLISADWPGFVNRTFEAAVPGVKSIFLNGAQGDVNHVNVFPRPGESNGMFHDFDDVDRGYPHARHMGNVVAGAALQVYEKLQYCDVESIDYKNEIIKIPANVPSPEELPLAIKYNELHKAGRDDEIPFKGMALTTVVAGAARKVRLKDGPDSFDFLLSAVRIGNLAFLGIPGEPFTSIGMGVKENCAEYGLVLPCSNTNGYEGYFPNAEAYAEGGYETETSRFRAGVAERITEEGTKLHKSF